MTNVAVVQTAPAFMDKTAVIEQIVESIQAAAEKGADLVVFTEAFLPGYPSWLWRLRPGSDWTINDEYYQLLSANAIDVSGNELTPVYDAAREHRLTVCLGIEERDHQGSRSTLYNSYITISPQGELINVHRKLMPTNPERMIWGMGDASGLRVLDTPAGRIGSLLCWENYMPQARLALYGQGIEVLLAPTYDSGENWLATLQYIAREGRCYVVGCGTLLQGRDFPDDSPGKDTLYPDEDEWVNAGDSVIIAPGGSIIAGPLHQQSDILYGEMDLHRVASARRALDVAGHYSRSDIFNLHVNNQAQPPVSFRNNQGENA